MSAPASGDTHTPSAPTQPPPALESKSTKADDRRIYAAFSEVFRRAGYADASRLSGVDSLVLFEEIVCVSLEALRTPNEILPNRPSVKRARVQTRSSKVRTEPLLFDAVAVMTHIYTQRIGRLDPPPPHTRDDSPAATEALSDLAYKIVNRGSTRLCQSLLGLLGAMLASHRGHETVCRLNVVRICADACELSVGISDIGGTDYPHGCGDNCSDEFCDGCTEYCSYDCARCIETHHVLAGPIVSVLAAVFALGESSAETKSCVFEHVRKSHNTLVALRNLLSWHPHVTPGDEALLDRATETLCVCATAYEWMRCAAEAAMYTMYPDGDRSSSQVMGSILQLTAAFADDQCAHNDSAVRRRRRALRAGAACLLHVRIISDLCDAYGKTSLVYGVAVVPFESDTELFDELLFRLYGDILGARSDNTAALVVLIALHREVVKEKELVHADSGQDDARFDQFCEMLAHWYVLRHTMDPAAFALLQPQLGFIIDYGAKNIVRSDGYHLVNFLVNMLIFVSEFASGTLDSTGLSLQTRALALVAAGCSVHISNRALNTKDVRALLNTPATALLEKRAWGAEPHAKCVLCFSDLAPGDRVATLPCHATHIFHAAGADECDGIECWLRINPTCPMCVAPLYSPVDSVRQLGGGGCDAQTAMMATLAIVCSIRQVALPETVRDEIVTFIRTSGFNMQRLAAFAPESLAHTLAVAACITDTSGADLRMHNKNARDLGMACMLDVLERFPGARTVVLERTKCILDRSDTQHPFVSAPVTHLLVTRISQSRYLDAMFGPAAPRRPGKEEFRALLAVAQTAIVRAPGQKVAIMEALRLEFILENLAVHIDDADTVGHAIDLVWYMMIDRKSCLAVCHGGFAEMLRRLLGKDAWNEVYRDKLTNVMWNIADNAGSSAYALLGFKALDYALNILDTTTPRTTTTTISSVVCLIESLLRNSTETRDYLHSHGFMASLRYVSRMFILNDRIQHNVMSILYVLTTTNSVLSGGVKRETITQTIEQIMINREHQSKFTCLRELIEAGLDDTAAHGA